MSSRRISGSVQRFMTPNQKTEQKLNKMVNTLIDIQTDIKLKQKNLNIFTSRLKTARDQNNSVKIVQFESNQQNTIKELNRLRELYNSLLINARNYSDKNNGNPLLLANFATIDVPFGMADLNTTMIMSLPDVPTHTPTRRGGGKKTKKSSTKSASKSSDTRKSIINKRRVGLVSALSHGISQANDPSFQQADTSNFKWKCRKCGLQSDMSFAKNRYGCTGLDSAIEHRKECTKGGKRIRKKTKKNRKSKKPSLKVIKDISKVLKCDNQRFGCDLKPFKKFHCYKRAKTNKYTTKPDSIYLTNKKTKGTRKLSKGVLKVVDWFDCSHFKD